MHVMLFDLYVSGHHASYMAHLARHWRAAYGTLSIVVPKAFREAHPPIMTELEGLGEQGVRLVLIEEPFELDPNGTRGLIRCDRTHGDLLTTYIDRLKPDHVLLMYFDHVQLSLARRLRFDRSVRFSGIYFRPSFHYPALSGKKPNLKQRLKDLRKRVVLRTALRNPHFDTLFCLDPFVVPHVQRLAPRANAVALPEPVPPLTTTTDTETMRDRIGVEAGRKMLLLFGAISRLKGVYPLLEAVGLLPDAQAQQVCLVLAGAITPAERETIQEQVAELQARNTVQVVVIDRFIRDPEIQDLMQAANLALLPYQHHVGMSNVLVRAAAVRVPVLGPDYGLVGALIRARRLGLSVDTTRPKVLAEGIQKFLAGNVPFDANEASRFADENTTTAYTGAILDQLLPG